METKQIILDIAMNLNRIGGWAIDGGEHKQKRVDFFLDQTKGYINQLNPSDMPSRFRKSYERFLEEFHNLEEKKNDLTYWGEMMMTWGNILTHRSKLL